MNPNLSRAALRSWFEDHPKAGNLVGFALGGLFSILGMSLTLWAKPWLPTWLPQFGGICAIGTVALLIADRIRNPVPQGQPESNLFAAMALFAIGAFLLIF